MGLSYTVVFISHQAFLFLGDPQEECAQGAGQDYRRGGQRSHHPCRRQDTPGSQVVATYLHRVAVAALRVRIPSQIQEYT